jgi:hypothetical protein
MNTRDELTERIESIRQEMAKAPDWKKEILWWWTDREREIEACDRRLELLEEEKAK